LESIVGIFRISLGIYGLASPVLHDKHRKSQLNADAQRSIDLLTAHRQSSAEDCYDEAVGVNFVNYNRFGESSCPSCCGTSAEERVPNRTRRKIQMKKIWNSFIEVLNCNFLRIRSEKI